MSATVTPPFPPARVTPHAFHALGGIWRLTARRFFTLGYWLTLAGLLAVLVVLSIPAGIDRSSTEPNTMLPWAAGFYVCFLVPILSFIGAASTMRDDLAGATVDYILTRPIRRPLFVAFRYLTQMAATQISFLFSFCTVIVLCIVWEVPDLAAAVPTLLLGQVCAIMACSAAGFLIGSLTSRYVIVGLVYGAVVEVGLGNVPTQLNQISLIRHLLSLVQPLLGEGNWSINQTLDHTSSTPVTVAILLLVSVVGVVLSALLFSWREFAGSGGRDA